jgi:hypothetical protein
MIMEQLPYGIKRLNLHPAGPDRYATMLAKPA